MTGSISSHHPLRPHRRWLHRGCVKLRMHAITPGSACSLILYVEPCLSNQTQSLFDAWYRMCGAFGFGNGVAIPPLRTWCTQRTWDETCVYFRHWLLAVNVRSVSIVCFATALRNIHTDDMCRPFSSTMRNPAVNIYFVFKGVWRDACATRMYSYSRTA